MMNKPIAITFLSLLFGCGTFEKSLSEDGRKVHVSSEPPPKDCVYVKEVHFGRISLLAPTYNSELNEMRDDAADVGGNYMQLTGNEAEHPGPGKVYKCPR